jgi:GNAT superfamily N-acetyltransferase
MVVSEMADSDLAEVVGLLNSCYRGSHEFAEYTPENFRSYLQETCSRVFVLRYGGTKGVATLFKSGWGNKIDLFAVEQGARSKEFGDALVSAIEAAAKVERLYTIIEEGDPSIGEWRERGYTDDGGWSQMIAELKEELPIPPIRGQATLRAMRPSDLESMVMLTNASFGFPRLSANCLEEWKREDPEFGIDWIFVAESGGRLVSMLVSKPDGEYNRNFGARRGYLGPAATLPEYRNKGLAAALTIMALNWLKRKGMTSVNLYTSIGNAPSLGLIKKLGFRENRTFLQLAKTFKK